MHKRIDQCENVLRSLIESETFSPHEIMIAMHNVCNHGIVLENVGYNVTDETLKNLYDGFEVSIKSLKTMSE